MPELPEVEGVVRALAPTIEGKTIDRVEFSNTIYQSFAEGKQCIVKNIEPQTFEQVMSGMKIKKVIRRAKYIYFEVEKGGQSYLFVNHLGMTGAWFVVQHLNEITEGKFRKHIHAIFYLTSGELLVFSDIRRFGEMRFISSIEDHPPLLQMAPEPFDESACEHFLKKCELPKYLNKPIKEVIMDGHVISGCGNIYATEALFKMGIHPGRKTSRISKERKVQLFETIRTILLESIEMGGSTISDYRNINGEAGGMQHRLKMYGKKICPNCSSNTKSMTIAGRTSVYCPKCQH
ncbi:formamidopyrimidine-DNA glycosylase [Lysinibacillus composti]|uniref:Bifunctional DNA-formamidopyrimidine glycosylase/DNA-(Apurinic or apyrimidinic site) lyase n=1 Tax=Lysinibacillus composti TaxID=720633 RepID=A0A3N9UKQ6_9BACI|nr:bifunctional DNA-formamidopyrimidine glycosylase/DNA-(apurinic or apyrimidinic site) lyase [Lysinibacillus composti]MBM7606869.1 formamidopyrimidine-DNA glycosylase [Lysinibacillus composti]RQW76524.1 bifunctional DNA-formamidopyrimidine glycosylase/DNA-(apurinic or apyrimidinic site) lyase [Lysinibacillus composti]